MLLAEWSTESVALSVTLSVVSLTVVSEQIIPLINHWSLT